MPRYIKATDAINVLSEFYNYRTDNEKFELALAISSVPTVHVIERKTGMWIKHHDGDQRWYECQVCGDYPLKSSYGEDVLTRFCPWCGAEMKGYKDAEKESSYKKH